MQINKAVLQIMDFTTVLEAYSSTELAVGEDNIQSYLQGHVDKAFKDPSARTGFLVEGSALGQQIRSYANGDISLVDLTKDVGGKIFSYMAQAAEPLVVDNIFCEVTGQNTYLCLLQLQAHEGFSHSIAATEVSGQSSINLVSYRAILPTTSQKLRAFFAIRLRDLAVRVFEPKGEYDGEVAYILAHKVLQIMTEQSSKDTVKKVRNIVNSVAQAHESDGVAEMALTKEMIKKNAEVSDTLNPVELIEQVFKSNPIQQEAAKKELAEEDMVKELPMSREFATKVGQSHKIKTDTGIEISFPVEYMKNSDFIEIVTNDDGTLRIELKNINKIMNR